MLLFFIVTISSYTGNSIFLIITPSVGFDVTERVTGRKLR